MMRHETLRYIPDNSDDQLTGPDGSAGTVP
jgi:hypothetical protein